MIEESGENWWYRREDDRPTIEVTELETYRRFTWRWPFRRRRPEQKEPAFGFARALEEGEP